MNISGKKEYVVKFIDELGNCYHQTTVDGLSKRQETIRKWINGERYNRADIGDVVVVIKQNGEELWAFEQSGTY